MMEKLICVVMAVFCVAGCDEKKPLHSDAEVQAAAEQVESIMRNYATLRDDNAVNRLLDQLKVIRESTNGFPCSNRLPMMGFFHSVFRQNPDKVESWKARAVEFEGTFVAEVLREARDFDEDALLAEEGGEGTLDYCWASFFASGDTKYVRYVIAAALADSSSGRVDFCQMAAVWSLHSLALQSEVIAKELNDALRTAKDVPFKRVANRFTAAERDKLFDAGIKMRMDMLSPAR